ncbi:MAG: hypothetical protein ACRYF0_11415 [Janthinobacterium lividum]
MTRTAFDEYRETGHISSATIQTLVDVYGEEKHRIYQQYIAKPDSGFARALLAGFTAAYKAASTRVGDGMTTDELKFAAYLVALNKDVSDVLLLWQTKEIDFDTHCGFDIQLVVFAGPEATISYLKKQADPEAMAALAYIEACCAAGDFDSLADYFSPANLPYWL